MATGWNAWSGTPGAANRNLSDPDRQWLQSNPQGGFNNGFYYRPNMRGASSGGDGGDGSQGTLYQWDRIAANRPEDITEQNRDWEAFDPQGNYTHSWVGTGENAFMRDNLIGLAAVGGAAAAGSTFGSGIAGTQAAPAGGFGGGLPELSTAGMTPLSSAGVGTVPSQVAGGAALGTGAAAGGGAAGLPFTARDVAGAVGAAAPLIASAGAPAPANTTALAGQQTSENERINNANLQANRPNVNSPFGSSTWTRDANGNWTQNVSLSPEEQGRLDRRYGLGERADGAAGRALDAFSSPFSFGGQVPRGARAVQPDISQSPFGRQRQLGASAPGYERFGMDGTFDPELVNGNGPGMSRVDLSGAQSPRYDRFNGQGPAARDLYGAQGYAPQRQAVEQAVQSRFERLREPQLQRQETSLDVQLRNQGLMPGSEGYDNAMNDLRQQQAAERSDIADRAILAGGAEQSRLAGIDLSADAQRFGQQQQGFRNTFDTTGYNNELTGRESGDTWGRTIQAFGFNNAAGQGEFDNSLRATGQRNTAREGAVSGNFDRGMRGLTYNNNLSRQGLTDALDIGNFDARQDNDVWGRYADTYRFGADERQREFDRDFRTTGYEDDRSLRARNQGLNEFQAFAGWGGPINMPIQGPTGMSNQQPFNYYGAGIDAYGMGADRYNRNIGAIQSGLNFATNWWG